MISSVNFNVLGNTLLRLPFDGQSERLQGSQSELGTSSVHAYCAQGGSVRVTIDGNEAAVSAAYRLNEVCCIYPITPSSPMAELADEWSAQGRPNIFGSVLLRSIA